jgi:hypothetical protein
VTQSSGEAYLRSARPPQAHRRQLPGSLRGPFRYAAGGAPPLQHAISLSLSLISAELDFAEELLETVLAQPFRQK